ncbi:hypothetical protein SSABA_v1c03610 [Spiroplasma sabaudiense Ar-1343]|uniref:Uncharacterized protein n=1 Tax=Spiroplasma sabaudiense Ar-1343 TaxID=1276257 RepID=W6AAA4_9MOLU|nr:hypothetical protein [Spiroplasma sabaudiense]AHI53770.1 hypothetical protein SSABA_v1c03610 [Spiroplasma sabaudiense Ar-1343]
MYKIKISDTNSRIKIKKNIIFASLITTSLLAGTLLLIPKNLNQIYNFDNINFNNQSEVIDYALSQGSRSQVEETSYYYKYKNKVYSMQERDEVIDKMINDALIKEESTFKNVNEFIISNSGELSSNVKKISNDKLEKVYKGRNGFSYLDLDEAVKTFQDYDEVILVENLNKNSEIPLEFYNENEAVQYLENLKKESLEKGEKSECYLVSGACQDEGAIKQWLKSNSTYKFRYKDYEWSNFAPAEASRINLTSEDKVYKDNIFEFEANKDAYWIDINNTGRGSFSGSQFIETNIGKETFYDKIQRGWTLKEESKVNLFLSSLLLFSEMSNGLDSLTRENEPESENWTLEKDVFLNNKELKNEFIKKVKELARIDLNSSQDGLSYEDFEIQMQTKAKNMDLRTKTLVFFRKLSNLSLMKNNLGSDDKNGNIQKFDDLCKITLKEVITTDDEKLNGVYDELFAIGNPKIFTGDVIDVFLNPASFQYKKDDTRLAFANVIKKINQIGDAIMDPLGELNDLVGDYFTKDGKSNGKEITVEDQKTIIKQQNLVIENKFKADEKIKLDDGKFYSRDEVINQNNLRYQEVTISNERKIINKDTRSSVSKLSGLTSKLNTVQQIWEMGNLLSPYTYKTMALDFGDGQELLYTYLSFGILGWELNPQDQAKYLTTSFLYDGIGNENDKGFRVRGSYFDDEEDAINYLKTLMIRDPHEYAEIQQFHTNIMDTNESAEIENSNQFTIEEQLDIFIDKIFKKYYANMKENYYTDGFGNKFNNQVDALISMRENITSRNFVKKYQWKDNNYIKRNYDTFEEMMEVQNNYIKNTYIEEKVVISSDLFSETNYEKLNEQSGGLHKFYSLIDGSQQRYFKTYDDAFHFVLRKNNFELNIEQIINYQITYRGEIFTSEEEFMNWVIKNTKIISGKAMVH